MQRLLLVLMLLAPAALTAQDNPNYDPDYDGDGCYSVADILGLLPLFGTCVDTTPAFACGDSVLFDDYWYETVLIGDQCWFAENLRTSTYANGELIPSGLTDGEWTSTTTGATAVYGEGSSSCEYYSPDIDDCDEAQSLAAYGRLYNWHAVDDARGLCPSGWHVPTDGEWMVLEMELGMSESEANSTGWRGSDQGTQLKSTFGWFDGLDGTDDFGFSALAGGYRSHYDGNFSGAGVSSWWWSSSPSGGNALYRYLAYNLASIYRTDNGQQHGFSVRCLSNTFTIQGCTDSSYIEFNPGAELDDGSCLTPLSPGCTDSLYVEFDPLANVDDGSCSTLASTCSEVEMDGYTYSVVEIGDQCWFSENLRTTVYANGDLIPAGLTDGEWASTTDGATAVYGEGSSDCYHLSPDIDACDEAQSLAEYGRLYNWYAVDDDRGLCPAGWHVPTDGEWTDLENYITSQGFAGTEGTALKSTSGWHADDNGTDDFGFSALPGGIREDLGGYFFEAGISSFWWSSFGDDPQGALFQFLSGSNFDQADLPPLFGFSVRCVKD